MYDWQDLFLYCYDCSKVRKSFNMSPRIPKPTQLYGVEGERAKEAAELAGKLKNGDSLLTQKVLEELGFAQPRGSAPPVRGGGADTGTHELPGRSESGMSGSIPSFIQPSEKYEDLFQDDDFIMTEGAIATTPISAKVGSALVDKRRLSHGIGSLVSTPETRSSKRVKYSQPATPSQEVLNNNHFLKIRFPNYYQNFLPPRGSDLFLLKDSF